MVIEISETVFKLIIQLFLVCTSFIAESHKLFYTEKAQTPAISHLGLPQP